jgi:sarcosine oxidase subunit gamma
MRRDETMNANVKTHPPKASPLTVSVLPAVARFNLRIAPVDLAQASKALGLTLSDSIGQGATSDGRAGYCLGPDEWLLHAPEPETAQIVASFAAIRATAPHSLTVISDREIAIAVEGDQAEELLSVGCPLNLARMAPGTAKRTVLDNAQVVLLRDAPDRFRIEVWRSFFVHVHELLEIAKRELASGF